MGQDRAKNKIKIESLTLFITLASATILDGPILLLFDNESSWPNLKPGH